MSQTQDYTFNTKERLLLKFGMPLVARLIRLWNQSCRTTIIHSSPEEKALIRDQGGCIYATWHQRMFYFFHYFGPQKIIMMISQSKDGEFATAVARHLGFDAVRGSTNRGAKSAMLTLIRRLRKSGTSAGMMVDGSQGPARILKMGTIHLARAVGKPVIPVVCGARRKIVFKSWDRYFLPMPFTEMVILHGTPRLVPSRATNAECEAIRLKIEEEMNYLADLCDLWWGGKPVGKPGYDLPAGDAG